MISWTIWLPGFDSWGKIAIFQFCEGWIPSEFDIVIPKTLEILEIATYFVHFQL